jgi:hypothetical protein
VDGSSMAFVDATSNEIERGTAPSDGFAERRRRGCFDCNV